MGTNYYLQTKTETGRCKDVHICKTSGGWSPSLRGYSDDLKIRSWFDWKLYLRDQTSNKGAIIFDEYDDPMFYAEFVKHIEAWQAGATTKGSTSKNHAAEALKGEFSRFWFSGDNPE